MNQAKEQSIKERIKVIAQKRLRGLISARTPHRQHPRLRLQPTGDLVLYSFMGSNPDDFRNRMLREAMEQQLPIIYFFGVGEATYEAIFPTFIAGWDAASF